MNILTGHIKNINNEGNLTMIDIAINNTVFTSIIVENSNDSEFIKQGCSVQLIFNASEVIIGKNLEDSSISIPNRFTGKVCAIKEGNIFTILTIDCDGFSIQSLMPTKSFEEMTIAEHDEIEALIKMNDIFLKQIQA